MSPSKQSFWDECQEMNGEKLLEMLSNNTLKKVKKTASLCNVSTVRTKKYITDDSRFRKYFLNICGHSDCWVTYSYPRGVVY